MRFREKFAEELWSFYYQDCDPATQIRFAPFPLFSQQPPDRYSFLGRLKQWLHEPDWVVFGAEEEGRLIGIALLKRYSTGPTSGVCVSPTNRLKGIGVSLMYELIGFAKSMNIQSLNATIEDDNLPSISLHKSLGFVSLDDFKTHSISMPSGQVSVVARRYILNL